MRRENEIGELIANQTGRTIAPGENLVAKKIIIDGQELNATGCYFILFEDITFKRGWFLKELLEECTRPLRKRRAVKDEQPSRVVDSRCRHGRTFENSARCSSGGLHLRRH